MVQLLSVHYLLYNLSKDYNVVDTVAYNKTSLESEDCEVELLYPKLSLFVLLPNTTNRDLDEVEDNMQVDQTASADTLMVLLTLLSQAEVYFLGERVIYS